jgi:hypothetical protein
MFPCFSVYKLFYVYKLVFFFKINYALLKFFFSNSLGLIKIILAFLDVYIYIHFGILSSINKFQ